MIKRLVEVEKIKRAWEAFQLNHFIYKSLQFDGNAQGFIIEFFLRLNESIVFIFVA